MKYYDNVSLYGSVFIYSSRFSMSMFNHLEIFILHLWETFLSYFIDKFLFFFIKMPII